MASLSTEQGLELLEDPNYADMTVICGQQSFQVHRAIVCTASPFFKACMNNNFVEGQTCTVTLQETKPLAIAFAIVFMYANDIDITQVRRVYGDRVPDIAEFERREVYLTIYTDLYLLADRLMLPELQARACQKFMSAFAASLAWRPSQLPVLLGLMRHVFNSTSTSDEDLRPRVVYHAAKLSDSHSAYADVGGLLEELEPCAFSVYKLSQKREL